MRGPVFSALALLGCAAAPSESAREPHMPARPPIADLQPATQDQIARKVAYDEVLQKVEERQRAFPPASPYVELKGRFAQGGLVFGRTAPGSKVRLDGEPVMLGDDGSFVVGFGRDSPLTALLAVTLPDGSTERIGLVIEDREFPVEKIDGLDQSKVSGFTEEQLKKIAADNEKKKAARASTQKAAGWAKGFDWPLEGPISGVFGSQRILNGEAKTPHSGLDIAAPEGAPVRAPADGVIRLADPDMYFEGGLIFLDHGHWLESAFMHLSRLDVEPGRRVAKGEVIGAVGKTGRATGPHLHWSLRWAGTQVDPQLVLPPRSGTAGASDAAPTSQ